MQALAREYTDTAGLSWFALMTQARAEKVTADRLKALRYPVLFLHYRVQTRRLNRLSKRQRKDFRAKPQMVIRPYFRRYLFVGLLPNQAFRPIATLPGVSSFVRNQVGPQAIDLATMDRLRRGADENGLIGEPVVRELRRERLDEGTVVRLTNGPATGLEGIVKRDEGDSIKVEMEFMGRIARVEVIPEDLTVLRRAA